MNTFELYADEALKGTIFAHILEEATSHNKYLLIMN